MNFHPPTIVWRHRRENLKKCSLRGLEPRSDMDFFTYPQDPLPDVSGYILLTLDGEPLTKKDFSHGLLILDGTWRYAEVMGRQLPSGMIYRSLPKHLVTAYPRRQTDCSDPSRGLASVEALYAAYHTLGWETSGLLDNYHWRDEFITLNFKES